MERAEQPLPGSERASCHLHLLSCLDFVQPLPLPPVPLQLFSRDLTSLSCPALTHPHSQGGNVGLVVCSTEVSTKATSCNPARPGWGN